MDPVPEADKYEIYYYIYIYIYMSEGFIIKSF
jgi:hypothetical protein